MRARPWTPADTRALRRMAAAGATLRQIADALGRSLRHVGERAARHGVEVRRVCVRTPWTPAEVRVLRKRYPHEPTDAVAATLGRGKGQVYQKALKLGLRKSPAYLARLEREASNLLRQSGSGTRFTAGQAAWNKGRPGTTGLHPNCVRTWFTKGRPPQEAHHYRPIGSERIDTKRSALVRKITDDPSIVPAMRWRPVHTMVWEAAHGPVPAGHIVVFRPGMKTFRADEITLDRIELVSHAENMLRNSRHTRYPPELNTLIQLIGALKRKLGNRQRKTTTLTEDGTHEEQTQ